MIGILAIGDISQGVRERYHESVLEEELGNSLRWYASKQNPNEDPDIMIQSVPVLV